MVKERFADWSRTEEPGYVPTGLPARQAQPDHPPPDPATAAAVGRRGRGQPACQRAPACARWSVSRRDHRRRTRSARVAHAPTAPHALDAPRARVARTTPRLRIGRVGALLAIFTVFALVSAVVFHVLLAQNQLELDRLNARITHRAAHVRAATADHVVARVAPARSSRKPSGSGWSSRPSPRSTSTCPTRRCPRPPTDRPPPSPTGRRRSRALTPGSRDVSGARRPVNGRTPRARRPAPGGGPSARARRLPHRRVPRPARPRTTTRPKREPARPLPPIRLRLVAMLVVVGARLRRDRRPARSISRPATARTSSSLGLGQRVRTVAIPAERGNIFDRSGKVLAVSVPQTTIVADPRVIKDPIAYAAKLAPIVQVDQAALAERLSNHTSAFAYVARKVNDQVDGRRPQARPRRHLVPGRVAALLPERFGRRARGGLRRHRQQRPRRHGVPLRRAAHRLARQRAGRA